MDQVQVALLAAEIARTNGFYVAGVGVISVIGSLIGVAWTQHKTRQTQQAIARYTSHQNKALADLKADQDKQLAVFKAVIDRRTSLSRAIYEQRSEVLTAIFRHAGELHYLIGSYITPATSAVPKKTQLAKDIIAKFEELYKYCLMHSIYVPKSVPVLHDLSALLTAANTVRSHSVGNNNAAEGARDEMYKLFKDVVQPVIEKIKTQIEAALELNAEHK